MKNVIWLHGHNHQNYFNKYKQSYIGSNAKGYDGQNKGFKPEIITVE